MLAATLNLIIKDALPHDVRAQKESIDLICYISNCFLDLLSDVANNVCYLNNKKNIVSEHLLKALQELHLDEYLPYLLSDDQNQKLADILKLEKKRPDGLHFTVKQIVNEDRCPNQRNSVVNTMLKRLSESVGMGDRKKRKKFKFQLNGMTTEQLEERQRKLLEGYPVNDESDDMYGTSNESPSAANAQLVSDDNYNQAEADRLYWEEYRNNWIQHNRDVLDQEYEHWV